MRLDELASREGQGTQVTLALPCRTGAAHEVR